MAKSVRSRRFILLLNLRYQSENELFRTVKAAPDGDGAAFVRDLMLMGFKEIKADKARTLTGAEKEGGAANES